MKLWKKYNIIRQCAENKNRNTTFIYHALLYLSFHLLHYSVIGFNKRMPFWDFSVEMVPSL